MNKGLIWTVSHGGDTLPHTWLQITLSTPHLSRERKHSVPQYFMVPFVGRWTLNYKEIKKKPTWFLTGRNVERDQADIGVVPGNG